MIIAVNILEMLGVCALIGLGVIAFGFLWLMMQVWRVKRAMGDAARQFELAVRHAQRQAEAAHRQSRASNSDATMEQTSDRLELPDSSSPEELHSSDAPPSPSRVHRPHRPDLPFIEGEVIDRRNADKDSPQDTKPDR
jgi:hypothetical protein